MSRAILVIGFLAACASPGAVTTRTVTDSAGVMIISLPAEDPAVPERALDLEHPIFALGGVADSSGDYSWVLGAVDFNAGRLIVTTEADPQFRVIDSMGHEIERFGRHGEGPGEFPRDASLWRHGDSLLAVMSGGGMTVVVLDSAFKEARRYKYHIARKYNDSHGVVAVLADGSVLDWTGDMPDDANGPFRVINWIDRVDSEGATLTGVLQFPGTERYALNGPLIRNMPVVFGRESYVTYSGKLLYIGTNDGFTINGYDMDGRLTRSIRIAAPEVRITAADRERYEREVREDEIPETRFFTAAMIDNAKYAETLRWYDGLYPTTTGGLWIERARLSDRDPRHLLVLDSTAKLIDRLTLPADAEPLWIGRDRALLRWRDADSVRNFVMVPIHPRTPAP